MTPRPAATSALLLMLAASLIACSDAAPPTAGTPLVSASPTAVPSIATTSAPSAAPSLGILPGGTGWLEGAVAVADQIGERFLFTCPSAGFNGFVWGTDTYTTGSSVCTAAVHAGLITFDAGGQVVIEIRAGQESYVGSLRNGVTSSDYQQWDWSFVFVTAAPTSAPSPTSTASGPVGSLPPPTAAAYSGELIQPGALVTCMSFDRTRFAERDAAGQPFGVDVEIAQAIAASLGVEGEIVEKPFDDLIGSVVGSECDITVSGHFITQARLEQMDMIPYREGVPHVVVQFGNPLAIDELTDLCGRKFAAVSGTVYVDMVVGAGDYVGTGLNDQCATAGAPSVDLQEFTEQQAAEDALGAGEVDAYAGNDFVVRDRPSEFELALELPRTRNGIGHRLALAELDGALRDALRGIIDDGTYLAILAKYRVEEVALTIRP